MRRLLTLSLLASSVALSGCMSRVMKAAGNGDAQRVKQLLEKGHDPNWENTFGVSNLMYASLWGQTAAVRALLDGGADVNQKGIREETALFGAARNGHGDVVELLLQRGAEPGYINTNGDTPLDLAQRTGDTKSIRLLKVAVARGEKRTTDEVEAAATEAAPAQPAAPSSDVDRPGYRSAERPDDFALVIGVGKYKSLPQADWARRDAETVKEHLLALGYPKRNVILLADSDATRSGVQSYVEEWLPRNVKPGSSVFVYYSGHGAPDTKTGEAFLVPWDGDPKFLQSSAYPVKRLYASLAKTRAKLVVVALDSCFSGAGGRSVLPKGARPLVTKSEDLTPSGSLTVLAAASADEITGALDEQGHGMFTYYLLKGLADGKRSAKALLDYAKPRVQDEARRQNREQTPLLLGADAPL